MLVSAGPATCLDARPKLALETDRRVLLAEIGAPRVMTTSIRIDNMGYRELTWAAEIMPGGTLALTLPVTSGAQGEHLWIVVDSAGYATGVYTGTVAVTAQPPETLDSPQQLDVALRVVPELMHAYLPAVLRNYTSPQTIILPRE